MKKFLKIMLIIIGAISLIFVALIGIGLFVDVEYDDHIENGRYTYVPEEENKKNILTDTRKVMTTQFSNDII